ncbi:unnamed protein product [Urochloa humidicola]
MVQQKSTGCPWQGPLPPPRVLPPRTLGDELTKATRVAKRFPRQTTTAPGLFPAIAGDATQEMGTPGTTAETLPFSKSESTTALTEATSTEFWKLNQLPIQKDVGLGKIPIGQGRWFRPTPGLVALFSRTGTRIKPRHNNTQHKSPPAAQSYAEVVRIGGGGPSASMANKEFVERGSSEASRGGGHGQQAGRGGGSQRYNPGFQPGFNLGHDGGGNNHGGRGRSRPSGYRGRGGYNSNNRGGYGRGYGSSNQGGYGRGYGNNDDDYYDGGYYNNQGKGYGRVGHGRGGGRDQDHAGRGGRGHNQTGRDGSGGRGQGFNLEVAANVNQQVQVATDVKMKEADDTTPELAMGAAAGTSISCVGKDDGTTVGKDKQQAEILAQGVVKVGGKKPYCYRCLTKGHINTECTTQIHCDICVTDTHVTKACPQAKAIKSTAELCGHAVDGLDFYYIPYAGKQKTQSESKAAVVKVLEGSMTVANVAVELERLLPGSSKWIVQEKEKNTFTTTFPSHAELTRMVLWGRVDTKCVKARMEIQEQVEKNIYKYEIPKCWVQFRGLSEELLDEFPIIWAVGTILGVPKMVDMKFTKQHGIARMRVAVLNPDLIPDLVEVLIGEYIYELQFRVEKEDLANNPIPINMDIEPDVDGNDDNFDQKEGEEKQENLGDMDATKNESKSGEHGGNNTSSQKTGKQTPVVVLSPSADGTNKWTATPVPSLDVKKVATGSLMEQENTIANISVMPLHTSKRNATAGDQDSIERAAKLKAQKNLEDPKPSGTNSAISFNSFLDATVVNNIGSVGVSLGVDVDRVNSSVCLLKSIEENRLSENLDLGYLNDASKLDGCDIEKNDDEELDIPALNTLCAELMEGLSEGDGDLSLPATP